MMLPLIAAVAAMSDAAVVGTAGALCFVAGLVIGVNDPAQAPVQANTPNKNKNTAVQTTAPAVAETGTGTGTDSVAEDPAKADPLPKADPTKLQLEISLIKRALDAKRGAREARLAKIKSSPPATHAALEEAIGVVRLFSLFLRDNDAVSAEYEKWRQSSVDQLVVAMRDVSAKRYASDIEDVFINSFLEGNIPARKMYNAYVPADAAALLK